jgi:hypothetical protein
MKSKIFFVFLSVAIFSQICLAKLFAVLKDVRCGEVSVYIDQEWSLAFSWDWESEVSSVIPLSQETLLISRDPND